MCIYIYIERERYVLLNNIYIYIYIYIYSTGPAWKGRAPGRGPRGLPKRRRTPTYIGDILI